MSCEPSCELQVPSRRNIMGNANHLGSSWAASWLQGIMAAAAAARRMSGALTSCYYCNTIAIATTILVVSSLLVISSVVVVNAVTDAGDGEKKKKKKKKKEKSSLFGWDAWACSTLFDFQATNRLSGKITTCFSFHKNPTLCFDKRTESTADFSTTCGLIWFGFVLCAACCSGCPDKPLFGLTATSTVVELEDQCKCWCWCWCGRSLCSELAGCCLLRSQCNWAVSVLLQMWLNLLVDDLQCGNITKLGKKKKNAGNSATTVAIIH